MTSSGQYYLLSVSSGTSCFFSSLLSLVLLVRNGMMRISLLDTEDEDPLRTRIIRLKGNVGVQCHINIKTKSEIRSS